MIKSFSILFIILFLVSKNLLAVNIGVINIDELINTNDKYKNIIAKLEINQKKNSIILQNNELELEKLLNEINDSKILLSEEEINKLINNYNNELNKFNILVESFNEHYRNEIINIRKIVLEEIIKLTENYANDKKIDLILDSSSYLIASNTINITLDVKKMLNKIYLKLEFKDFEKN